MLQHLFWWHISHTLLNTQHSTASLPLPNLSLRLRDSIKVGWTSAGLSKSLATPTSSALLLPPRAVQGSLPGQWPSRCLSRRDATPRGDAGRIPVPQEMWGQGCCRKPSPSASTPQPRARADLWLERLLTTREASLCSGPVS